MEELLDRSKKYLILDQDEKFWLFVYESVSEEGAETATFSWHGYYKKPGQGIYIPNGPWSEEYVFKFLIKHSHKLDADDRLDLYNFVNKGGLEEFLEKEHKLHESK